MVNEAVWCMRDVGVVGAAMICILDDLDDSLSHTVTVPKYRGYEAEDIEGVKMILQREILRAGYLSVALRSLLVVPLVWTIYVRLLVQSNSDPISIDSINS